MTGATYFLADERDTDDLAGYLGDGGRSVLRPWPLLNAHDTVDRSEIAAHTHMLVVNEALGEPVLIGAGDPAMTQSNVSGVFNRMNLGSVSGVGIDRIVDFDASPVLLWKPGSFSAGELRVGTIGAQALSPKSVSAAYDRWATRVASWIRRRGTVVWGLKRAAVRPELDIDLPFLNSVYALPGAMELLASGARAR